MRRVILTVALALSGCVALPTQCFVNKTLGLSITGDGILQDIYIPQTSVTVCVTPGSVTIAPAPAASAALPTSPTALPSRT